MAESLLQLIANGNYTYSRPVNAVHTDEHQAAELFTAAYRHASKLIGQHQDRNSKRQLGSLFKSAPKSSRSLDARRFTSPLPLTPCTPEDNELYARVTLTEEYGRQASNKQFHVRSCGAIAVKLFVITPDLHELALHSAIAQQKQDVVHTHIEDFKSPSGQGMAHVLALLEETRANLAQ